MPHIYICPNTFGRIEFPLSLAILLQHFRRCENRILPPIANIVIHLVSTNTVNTDSKEVNCVMKCN